MQMTNKEIVFKYQQADDKSRTKKISILADLNACSKEEIRKILREAGCDVPQNGNRYTSAKKDEDSGELKIEPSAETPPEVLRIVEEQIKAIRIDLELRERELKALQELISGYKEREAALQNWLAAQGRKEQTE